MAEALYHCEGERVDYTPSAAVGAGEVLQLDDGRAAFATSDIAASEMGSLQVCGQAKLAKSTEVYLKGQRVFWDVSASTATYTLTAGQQDFYVGFAAEDAATGDATVTVQLNAQPNYSIDLRGGRDTWTTEATNGLGVASLVGGGVSATFDAVAEAAQAAIYSVQSFPASKGWIAEFHAAIFDIGDDAALDISIGVANGSHATDFDSVTESVVIHLDGAALDILAESDDGTTEVAATDTTVNAVDDTYFFVQIDGRDSTDVKFYINGARVLSGSTFKTAAATGPLKAILHIEKTSNDTTADVRVKDFTVRTCEVAA